MQSTSDEVLIGRIANGDRLAMQVLYARYHVRVFRFVVRLVRDESTAEDLISEVFLDVWRQGGSFEGRSAVSTWLLAIARFKALSILRRKREEELDDEGATAVEDPNDNPEAAVEKMDRSDILRQCLTVLSREHRETVRMSFDMATLFAEREAERYQLHSRYLNEQLVRVLKAIGYDVRFVS